MRAPLLVALLLLAAAGAADPIEPILFEVREPAGCPAQPDFVAAVQARTSRMRLASAEEPARRFSVEVSLEGRRARGRLVVRDVAGAETVREVHGDSCAAVIDALALVAALAIDPHASLTPRAPAPPAPSPSPSPTPLAAPPPRIEARPGAPRPQARWRFGAGIGVGAVEGILPSVAADVAPFVEVSRVGPRWSAALRLGFAYDFGAKIHTMGGNASLSWYAGRVDLCPARIKLFAGIRLDPCLRLDAGAVWARGQDVLNARAVWRPWVAPGVVVGLEREFADRLFLRLDVAVQFPVIRDHFSLDPDFTVEAPPPAGVRGGAGVGVHFL